jgi:hypothetical protein
LTHKVKKNREKRKKIEMRTSHGEATHGDPKVMSGKAIDCRYRDGFKKARIEGGKLQLSRK